MTTPSGRPWAAFAFALLAASGLAVAGCSGGQSGPATPAGPPLPVQGSTTLTGRGPSLHLANGDGVAILSPRLGRSSLVTVTSRPGTTVPAPESWSILPGTLHVGFSPALRSGAGNQPGLRVTLGYPRERAASVRGGWALRVEVEYASGPPVGWVAYGTLDQTHDRVSADLPASLLGGATGATIALGVDSGTFSMQAPGPRYWNGKAWSPNGSIVAGKSTVVLVHGIFSSVEEAFPTSAPGSGATPCPQKIAGAGHFQQVLGFDYKWYEPPTIEGPLLAAFLKTIARAGVSSVTIEAHSYGSLISLAAVPAAASALKVNDVVTLGGPLPLRGTPLAKPSNAWRMRAIMEFLDWLSGEPPGVVDQAFKSGMVASLATNSTDLHNILEALDDMTTKPRLFEVAGNQWIVGEDTLKDVLIDGSGVKLPWDGVVETIAAASKDLPNPTARIFALSHIELECSDSVIAWVGGRLNGP